MDNCKWRLLPGGCSLRGCVGQSIAVGRLLLLLVRFACYINRTCCFALLHSGALAQYFSKFGRVQRATVQIVSGALHVMKVYISSDRLGHRLYVANEGIQVNLVYVLVPTQLYGYGRVDFYCEFGAPSIYQSINHY